MLRIEHLAVSYGAEDVLRDVSFELEPGKFTAVIGQNGCGKSTLAACINQQLAYRGEIYFEGENLKEMPPRRRARKISMLPQMLVSPHITVEELVALGRSPYLGLLGRMSGSDREAVESAMESAGISGLRGKFTDELSGGERQKAYLAMILAQDCGLMVLDEPTTYMDITYEGWFLEKLDELRRKQGKTLLVIMHNLSQAVRFAENIVVLKGGKVFFSGDVESCLERGVIEDVFSVKKHMFNEEGERFVFFS